MSAKTILVVDDDAFIRLPLEFILREEGYRPITAINGNDALQKLEWVRPDLIFLDVMMPGLDGFTTCRRIKANPRWASIPVILLTAKGQDNDRERAIAVGAIDLMTKPYSPALLLRRLRKILSDGDGTRNEDEGTP